MHLQLFYGNVVLRSGVLGCLPPQISNLFQLGFLPQSALVFSCDIFLSPPTFLLTLSFHILTVLWLASNANGLARHSSCIISFLYCVCMCLQNLSLFTFWYFLVFVIFFTLPHTTAPMCYYHPVISPLFRCALRRHFIKLLLFSHIINKSSIAAPLHPKAPGPWSKAGKDIAGRTQHRS